MQKKIVICPICKNAKCEFIIERKNVPIVQNVICEKLEDSIAITKDYMEIYYCDTCTHIFNSNAKNYEQYNLKYDNSQINSGYFKKYINWVSSYINDNIDLSGKNILEIGCGQGDFINLISKNKNCSCFGFDPSLKELIHLEKIKLYNKFFDEKYAESLEQKMDLVILRHIMEHIIEPNEIIKNVYKVLKNEGKVYIEVPSCEYILKNYSLFDILYEHCNYFNIESLKYMMSNNGMEVVDYFYGFDNQYLGILAVKNNKYKNFELEKEKHKIKIDEIKNFKQNINMIEEKIIEFIKLESENGKFAFWGAGAKGMMSCNLFDIERKYVDCVIDIKKSRDGTYIGGTGHLIITPEHIISRNIKSILVLNPNYYQEILMQVNSLGIEINVYNIDSVIKDILGSLNVEGI